MAKNKEIKLLVTTQVIENGTRVYKMAGETAKIDSDEADRMIENGTAEDTSIEKVIEKSKNLSSDLKEKNEKIVELEKTIESLKADGEKEVLELSEKIVELEKTIESLKAAKK